MFGSAEHFKELASINVDDQIYLCVVHKAYAALLEEDCQRSKSSTMPWYYHLLESHG